MQNWTTDLGRQGRGDGQEYGYGRRQDFPDSKGLIRQDTLSAAEGSLAGQVLRSGKVWVGDISELRRLGINHEVASGEGMESIWMLPLCRRHRVLGVLCLARIRKNAFTLPEIEFLSQIARQVAIAIDNAFAYCQKLRRLEINSRKRSCIWKTNSAAR